MLRLAYNQSDAFAHHVLIRDVFYLHCPMLENAGVGKHGVIEQLSNAFDYNTKATSWDEVEIVIPIPLAQAITNFLRANEDATNLNLRTRTLLNALTSLRAMAVAKNETKFFDAKLPWFKKLINKNNIAFEQVATFEQNNIDVELSLMLRPDATAINTETILDW